MLCIADFRPLLNYLLRMTRVDVVNTIFQTRKPPDKGGIEHGEYVRGFGIAGIIECSILFHENPCQYHRFSRYLYWNDSEPDCEENKVLSTYDDTCRKTLWDDLFLGVLNLSDFDS